MTFITGPSVGRDSSHVILRDWTAPVDADPPADAEDDEVELGAVPDEHATMTVASSSVPSDLRSLIALLRWRRTTPLPTGS
jgi:hypothetical protein